MHIDEVIVSTAFNKLQSQNVMKVEHETLKSLQQKGTSTLIEGLATIPGVSQVSTKAMSKVVSFPERDMSDI